MSDANPGLMTIFADALEQTDPIARAAYLDHACGSDTELRQRVEALLAAHSAAGRFLEPAASSGSEVTATFSSEPDSTGAFIPQEMMKPAGTSRIDRPNLSSVEPGTIIAGRYTLIEVIGEGGMGSVFLAEQTEPVKRQVALKLIKIGMDSKAVLARFDAERQALALMDHPNIARIYDGGLTPPTHVGGSPIPFFVMELVQGVPLTEYCDSKRLTVDARLQLFVQVCQAVQHAHQKGIIHRDLKPSNVLVTEVDGRPTPKVIDFGVAKATEQKLTDLSFADVGAVVGTPAYMSPEQADPTSMDIDTRTDVYALGVMLYELLTGSPPIDSRQFKRGAILEMLRMVREVEPPRPSTKLSTADALPNIAANRNIDPAKLAKLLRGELDWVVMKALEKDRTRRYDTANGLARDIQRYLADEVVEARPPSAGYRLKKFVRRHKGQVIAASLVLLALVGGIVGTSIGMVKARRANSALLAEQIKVENRFEMARKSIAMFHTVITDEKALENDAFKDLRKKLLTEAAKFYRELETLLAGEADAKSRKALADGLVELGDLNQKIGDQKEALAAYRRALAIRRELAAVPGADVETRLAVAVTLRGLGRALHATGDPVEAFRAYEESRDLASALDSVAPTAKVRQALAMSHNNIGVLLSQTGKSADALVSHETARDLRLKLADANPAVADYQSDLAMSHINIGNLLSETGKTSDALVSYQKARDIQQMLADANPAVANYQSALAQSHYAIGKLLAMIGRPADALVSHETVRDLRLNLVDANPAVADYQSALAESHYAIGRLLADMGKTLDALVSYQKARDIQQKLADANPAVTRFQSDLAYSHHAIGQVLSMTGKTADALASYQKARDIRQKLADANPAVTDHQRALAWSHQAIGIVLFDAGKSADALTSYEKARDIRQKLAVANPAVTRFQSDLAYSHHAIGNVLLNTGSPGETLASYQKARDIRQKLADANPAVTQFQSDLAHSHHAIGNVLLNTGSPGETLASYQKGRDIRQKLADANPAVADYQSDLAYSHNAIGLVLSLTWSTADALASHEKARDIQQKLADANPAVAEYQSALAYSHNYIGQVLSLTGKPAHALAAYEKAKDIQQKLADANPTISDYQSGLARSQYRIGQLLTRMRRDEEAITALNQGQAICQKLAQAYPANSPYRLRLGYSHAFRGAAHAQAGRPAEAAADLRKAVELWAKTANPDGEDHFEKARALALLAKLGGDPKSGVTAEEAKTFADKAIAALADAIKAGWGQLPELKESDFDGVRNRADFQKLVRDIERANRELLPMPRLRDQPNIRRAPD